MGPTVLSYTLCGADFGEMGIPSWYKIHFDGSVHRGSACAGAAYLIRDHLGTIVAAAYLPLWNVSVPESELRG